MKYRFAPARSFEDLASGLVLRSAPGHPGFPVRLASELFQRALNHLGRTDDVVLWDPFCGSGQLVTSLALLHREAVLGVVASDIDPGAVALAARNLALTAPAGLAARREEVAILAQRHGRESHARAVAAADRLAQLPGNPPEVRSGTADATDPQSLATLLGGIRPHVVVSDLPYGEQTGWGGTGADVAAERALQAVSAVMAPGGVVVLVNRGRRPEATSPAAERVRVGRRVAAVYATSPRNQPVRRRPP